MTSIKTPCSLLAANNTGYRTSTANTPMPKTKFFHTKCLNRRFQTHRHHNQPPTQPLRTKKNAPTPPHNLTPNTLHQRPPPHPPPSPHPHPPNNPPPLAPNPLPHPPRTPPLPHNNSLRPPPPPLAQNRNSPQHQRHRERHPRHGEPL